MSFIKDHSGVFSCPVCSGSMTFTNQSLCCENRHSYDLARMGYLNFLSKPVSNDYDKQMLSSRELVMNAGFFHPLLSEFISLLTEEQPPFPAYLLDAGCGEGTHLSYLLNHLSGWYGVGIDLSKDGIQLAAKKNKEAIWCVADLSRTPLATGTFQRIVNILSPANYHEFDRLLAPKGMLLKAVPASGYLKELREIFYKGSDHETYDNRQVVDIFARRYPNHQTKQVQYKFAVPEGLLPHIINMSPLSWSVTEEQRLAATTMDIPTITMDFTLLTTTTDEEL